MKTGLPTWLWRTLAFLGIAAALALIIGDTVHSSPGGSFGFQADLSGATVSVVRKESAAARAGIVPGDTLTLVHNTLTDRVNYNEDNVAERTRLAVRIAHHGRSRATVLVARGVNAGIPAAEAMVIFIAFDVIRLVFVLVAIVIVVRRPERADARALATFFIAFAAATLQRWPWYPAPIAAVLLVVRAAFVTFALAQAARFATLFPRESARGIRRHLERAIPWVAALGMLAVAAANLASLVNVGAPGPVAGTAAFIVYLAATVIVLLALAVGFIVGAREAAPVDRPRLRWVALSIAIGLGGLIPVVILQLLGVQAAFVLPLILLVGAIPLGTGYAILRHHMLDVGFVINRALVFGAASALIVALFTLLEFFIGKSVTALGHVQSFILEALAALAIGASLRGIHDRADAFVDNVFFRERHRAERALRRLAREAAYINDPETLAERVVTAVARHAEADSAALYLHDDGGGFALRCAAPDHLPCAAGTLDEDDSAIVRARADGEPIELDELATDVAPSALPGVLAFPMIVRGDLVGLLSCGAKRSAERYPPDERAVLSELAHATGIAFDTLQTTALRSAVARALEDGNLEPLRDARSNSRGTLTR